MKKSVNQSQIKLWLCVIADAGLLWALNWSFQVRGPFITSLALFIALAFISFVAVGEVRNVQFDGSNTKRKK